MFLFKKDYEFIDTLCLVSLQKGDANNYLTTVPLIDAPFYKVSFAEDTFGDVSISHWTYSPIDGRTMELSDFINRPYDQVDLPSPFSIVMNKNDVASFAFTDLQMIRPDFYSLFNMAVRGVINGYEKAKMYTRADQLRSLLRNNKIKVPSLLLTASYWYYDGKMHAANIDPRNSFFTQKDFIDNAPAGSVPVAVLDLYGTNMFCAMVRDREYTRYVVIKNELDLEMYRQLKDDPQWLEKANINFMKYGSTYISYLFKGTVDKSVLTDGIIPYLPGGRVIPEKVESILNLKNAALMLHLQDWTQEYDGRRITNEDETLEYVGVL